MHCPVQNPEHNGVLLDYCAQTLSRSAVSEFEEHLSTCADCRRFVAAQQELWKSLDSWQPAPISENFNRELYARIGEFEKQTIWQRLGLKGIGWKPALSLGAACAAMALAFVIPRPSADPSKDIKETSKIESVEPDQIERALDDLDMLKQISTPSGQNL